MKSIAGLIDGPTLAAEVRMERQKHKGSFLLLEGATDVKRFERFIDEGKCSFVNCFGKPNVKGAVDQLYDDGFSGAVGMVDADFDRLLNLVTQHEGLIWSDGHDFDLDTAITTVFERYLGEVADPAKVAASGGPRAFLAGLLSALKPLSALRFANEKHGLGYSLTQLEHDKFFDGATVDIEKLIEYVSWGKFSSTAQRDALRSHIQRYATAPIDLIQMTCGHDFCAALGIALRAQLGSRKSPQTWRSEIEMHFRLALDFGHLKETGVVAALSSWEAANEPYRVLRV